MNEFLKLTFGALASAAGVAGILYGLISRLSRPGKWEEISPPRRSQG